MAIKLLNISKKYGEHLALECVNFEIKEGVTTCIMGPSGCGKTTLLRLMLGLENFEEGMITGLSGLKKSVVFQEDRLCENLTVATNIRMISAKKIDDQLLLTAIEQVGLPSECLKRQVSQLSGGQKRRITILRALMSEYDILFMDEPFKGLDLETKKQVMRHVRNKTKGKTVVLVTHDQMECEAMGGDVIYF